MAITKKIKKQPCRKQGQFSHSVVSDSATPGTAARQTSLSITNSRSLLKLMSTESVMPSNHLTSVIPFSSRLQSFPASGSFPMSQFFASGGQRTGGSASVSVLPMNIQDWFPLGWTGWISVQSKGLSRVSSNTTVKKHQFCGIQLHKRAGNIYCRQREQSTETLQKTSLSPDYCQTQE